MSLDVRHILAKICVIFFCLAWTVCGTTSGQTPGDSDALSIDTLMKAFYQSISFREGQEPDLERFRSLFDPAARCVRITPAGVDSWDISGFLSSFSERVKAGQVKSFYEAEIARRSESYGSLAQVFSTYEKGMNTENPKEFKRGINSLQLSLDGERWWIISLTWQDEQSNLPIPEKYLR